MTTLIVGLLLMPQANLGPSADAVMARYATWAKANVIKQVKVHVESPRSSTVDGVLLIDGTRQLLYRAGVGKLTYAISVVPDGVVDIDFERNLYDEQPYPGGAPGAHSRISGIYSNTMPAFLFRGTLKGLIPPSAEYVVSKVSGGDQLKSHFKNEMMVGDIRIVVDAKGKVVQFDRRIQSPDGVMDVRWRLSYLPLATKVSNSAFKLSVPLGLAPFSLPDLDYPIQRKDAFPAKGWTDKATGKAVQLHGPVLLAVLDKADFTSDMTRASLAHLQRAVPVFSAGDPGKGFPGALKDPTGKNLKAIHAPATPFFVLVDSEGKVSRTWMGFDRSHADVFEQEVRAALKK